MLELDFHLCTKVDGTPFPCTVSLVAVDNARERMLRPNQVRGILAASHPHSWLNGLWFRPVPALFGKAPAGLTGACGMLHSKMFASPAGAGVIVGARLLLFRLPEPEIEFPAGTDLILKIASPERFPSPGPDEAREDAAVRTELVREILTRPVEVLRPDRSRAADLINFAFVGSRDQLERSFKAAGWSKAEPLNAKTFARTYSAVAAMKTYASAPVSPLYYRDRLPELVYQRAFNSLAKRHHVRFWPTEALGETIWLGAATHDVGITFDWGRLSFSHRIDPRIDRERNTILNDLTDSGCISGWQFLDRPELKQRISERAAAATDGGLVAVVPQPCMRPSGERAHVPRKRPLAILATRRVVLETRHYVTRGNPYYWAYRTLRWGIAPRQRDQGNDE